MELTKASKGAKHPILLGTLENLTPHPPADEG